MGQYWMVVNLDKCETLGGWGKLGEWLIQAPDTLLFTLAAKDPPKLPDCDSLIRAVEPGAVCEHPLSRSLGKTFRVPQRIDQSCRLLKMPKELIVEIFSLCDDTLQVIYLGLTCQDLWEIARHQLYRRIATAAAELSWAGDRVICIGDYLDMDDLPENLLTADEKEEFQEYESLYEYPWSKARVVGQREPLEIMEELGVHKFPMDFLYDMDYSVFRSLVDWSFELPWIGTTTVLRNLSRRQFVRGAALEEWKETTDINDTGRITVNEIVLSRICCSSDPSVSMAYEGDLHRGVWAGDRFDFVPCEWVDELKEDEGWTDVSDEVLKEIGEIWLSEFGRSR
ncbi:hypothetical protein FB45DRAFT_26978 [Roridomyces roridus]|uniref:Uncharacterized protein n=1 Tax=Roridomyces roridus TaxID=1738132 RepID=A0AAD7CK54_9AGAR|nr:hypothetical protein FB45DRAFT_26978 [Roridomyces roridus]